MALASGVKDEVAFRDLDKLLVAAKRPNIAVKVSALPCYTDAPYPYHTRTSGLGHSRDDEGSRNRPPGSGYWIMCSDLSMAQSCNRRFPQVV